MSKSIYILSVLILLITCNRNHSNNLPVKKVYNTDCSFKIDSNLSVKLPNNLKLIAINNYENTFYTRHSKIWKFKKDDFLSFTIEHLLDTENVSKGSLHISVKAENLCYPTSIIWIDSSEKKIQNTDAEYLEFSYFDRSYRIHCISQSLLINKNLYVLEMKCPDSAKYVEDIRQFKSALNNLCLRQ